MIRETTACLAISSVALLTACGGGGGGGGDDATPATSYAGIETRQDLAANVTKAAPTLFLQVAEQLPQRGRVTQSLSESRSGGVAFDDASTSFDGRTLTLNIERAHGATITLRQQSGDSISSPFAGNTAREGRYWGATASSAAAAFAVVDWDNDDPSSYLAGGTWMYAATESVGVGAFVDGPELGGAGPDPTLTGTATYDGRAGGVYSATYGTDFLDVGIVPGSTEVGEFTANIELTADFGENTIGGCIACDESMVLGGVYTDGNTGESRLYDSIKIPARSVLPPTEYDANGWFSSDGVVHEDRRFRITESNGQWAGEFSTIPNSDGEPRAVAGTVGGYLKTAGGGVSAYVGAWYGTKP